MDVASAPQMLLDTASVDPDRPWFVEVDGRRMTYGQALEQTRIWTSALASLGVGAGDCVVTMLPNDADSAVAWFALSCLKALDTGCNHAYVGSMLSYILNDSGARVMLVTRRFVERLAAIDRGRLETVVVIDAADGSDLPTLPGVTVLDRAAFLARGVADHPLETPDPWDVACITYTSGTTGASKGVLIPWGQIHAQCGALFEDFSATDVMYSIFPPFHASSRFCIFLTLQRGGRFVARDGFKGSLFWSDVREHEVTACALTGTMANFVYQLPPDPRDAENGVSEMMVFPLPFDHEGFARRYGVRLRTCFTSTEICVPIVTDASGAIDDPASCGVLRTAEPLTQVRLVDEHDLEVPAGDVGELVVRTDRPWTMNVGYLGKPEATAAAWRNGWFHTGDCFRVDDQGRFYFVDRVKDALRRRGENISSVEVEGLIRQHPAVRDVAVIGVPSELGEDEVYAVLELLDDRVFDHEEFVAFLEQIMPGFMVPRFVEVVDELPRTEATFRVRKVDLRARGVTTATWDRQAVRS